MSELIDARRNRNDFRRQLLTTVSGTAFLMLSFGGISAKAADGDKDRPTIWIELGGQLQRIEGQGEQFSPPFVAAIAQAGFTSPLKIEQPPHYSFGGEAKLSYEPEGSGWIFSASALYGRSNGAKKVHQQSGKTIPFYFTFGTYRHSGTIYVTRYADTKVSHSESHAVVDFQAGKDIGIGVLGGGGQAVLNFGVRFAQFSAKSNSQLKADPDAAAASKYAPPIHKSLPLLHHQHSFAGTGFSSRSFRGVGPSLAWNGSAALLGNPQNSEVTLDLGANAAILFGRQKVNTGHQTHGTYTKNSLLHRTPYFTSHYQRSGPSNPSRRKSVMVPNFGGFAGLSLKFPNAKVSMGYRADFFFGAVDGGNDTRVSKTLGFYGPYAALSVGL